MLLDHDPAHAFMPYPAVAVANATSGPLVGLTFAVKDLFDVAGYPTSGGNPTLLARSGVKTTTAPTVQTLLDAGAAFVGKTITDELAFSMNGQNAHFGHPINGADNARITGGSSSGSAAAVSNRLCDFALGTDTGGSVRAPANHCGLFGIRPTHGRISLQGALALSPSLDTCGFFARDIATFTRVAQVLLGQDPFSFVGIPRLLVPTDVADLLTSAVSDALMPAMKMVVRACGPVAPCTVALDSFERMYWSIRYIQGYEAWQTDGDFIERYQPALGPGVKERFLWSKEVTAEQDAQARLFRQQFTTHLEALLRDDGVLVLPTMPDVAPRADTPEVGLQSYRDAAIKMLCISGLSGFPQLCLPLASRDGAPLGLSLIGPRGSDRSLIEIAKRVCAI